MCQSPHLDRNALLQVLERERQRCPFVSKLPNYYRILGVHPMADQAAIKRAYRALAKHYHPDAVLPERREWARNQMARINAAYQTLHDPHRRIEYDQQCGAARFTAGMQFNTRHADRSPDAGSFSTTNAIWQRRRTRERFRREQTRQWRTLTMTSMVGLLGGILFTALFVRTPTGYLISAMIHTGLLIVLLSGLIMANR